jgi:hypothetical protein
MGEEYIPLVRLVEAENCTCRPRAVSTDETRTRRWGRPTRQARSDGIEGYGEVMCHD